MISLELVKFARKKYFSSIEAISTCLFDHFNVVKFYFYKLNNSGSLFLFDSNLDAVDCYESKELVQKCARFCHPKHHTDGKHEIINYNEDILPNDWESLRADLIRLKLDVLLRFVKHRNNTVEEFGFSLSNPSEKQCRFLVNSLAELRFLAEWFTKNNTALFSFLEENSFDLLKIVGPDFYKNRLEEADPFYHRRQHFLQDLGVKRECNLTLEELDTVRLIVKGYSAAQIGKQLYRSKRTIEHRIEKIKSLWGCLSKVELIQKAQELEHVQAFIV